MEIDIEELASRIAAKIAPDALLNPSDVAVMLGVSARHVLDVYQGVPGFPKAIRLTGKNGTRGKPKWIRRDITAWIHGHREGKSKTGGRPRRDPYED